MAESSITLTQRSFSVATSEGRAFLQGRIADFTRAMVILIATILVTVNVGRAFADLPIADERRFVGMGIMAVVLVVLANMWRVARGRLRSELMVRILDVACTVDPAALIAIAVYVMRDIPGAPVGAILLLTFLVLGRALIIPSTARHTAFVSTLAALPVIVCHATLAWKHPETLLVGAPTIMVLVSVVWSLAAVALATYGSHIIYGLREEIREAQQLGQYTLGEKIGEGGMGIVHRAQHALLRRPTAIKLVPREKAGETALARFEREVQTMAELNHPNTVHVYDYGHTLDGTFYYAMELLDGIDLEALVERDGPQPPGRVVFVLRQVCAALTEAHDRGLVHRDIKPANVFLCHRGGIADVVKVLDFGLVKELDRAGGTITQADVVAGTPAFLSPESISDPDAVGPATDLYALGAVAHFLLTGTHVFTGATMVQICSHHLHSVPPTVEEHAGMAVSDELQHLITQCLAKAPEERPPGARALRRALASVPEAGSWTEEDAERWWREVAREGAA